MSSSLAVMTEATVVTVQVGPVPLKLATVVFPEEVSLWTRVVAVVSVMS